MKISLIAAISENYVIGHNNAIPWLVSGEQLMFKALTYNKDLLVGRRTFEEIKHLPDRRFAVLTSDSKYHYGTHTFNSVENALKDMPKYTDHLIVVGGGSVYRKLIHHVDVIHLTIIHTWVNGNVFFPRIPEYFECVFEQKFESNIDYTYRILTRK